VPPVNQLQILCRGIPAIEQDRARLELLVFHRIEEQLVEVVVLGLAVHVRGIPPRVNGVEILIFACAVHEADDSNPPDHTMLVPTVLRSHQLDESGVPFIMDAVIHNEKSVRALGNPLFDQLPELPRQKAFLPQEIIDHVMADVFQVLSQIRTGAVLGRTHQILDMLLFGNHAPRLLFSALKRKS
jgi:hypothetical protein